MTNLRARLVLLLAVTIPCVGPIAQAAKSRALAPRTIELPRPAGPHAVGRMVFRWSDSSRPDPLAARQTGRDAIVWLWYPAAPADGVIAAPYYPDLDQLASIIKGRESDAWKRVVGHAVAGAPFEPAAHAYPVVIFSPGNEMNSASYAFLIEELVSRGYVVAAIDHPYDARAVVLSDGSVAGFASRAWPPPQPSHGPLPSPDSPYARAYRDRVEVRARDALFVVERLEALNRAEPRFAQLLDLSKIGVVGHSIGGVAAGRTCQLDRRFKSCLNLDGVAPEGPFYLTPDGRGVDQPYALMTKPFVPSPQNLAEWHLTRDEWTGRRAAADRSMFGHATGGAYRVTIEGASHQSFTDDPFIIGALTGAKDAPAHERRMQVIRRYAVAFLERHLAGREDTLLDGQAADFPEVQVERWPVG